MKLALMLGGVAAGRRAGGPGELLGRGMKLLDSPELAGLRDQVQGRLMEAGKGAVMAVATRQLESLSDRVSQRVERLGDPSRVGGLRDVVEPDGGRDDAAAERGRGARSSRGREDRDEYYDEAEDYEEAAPADERSDEDEADARDDGEPRRAARPRPAAREAASRASRAGANPRRAASGVTGGARAATGRVRRGTRSER